MDRRMLIGLKQRAERASYGAARLPVPSDGGTFASIAP
jgi:hypothetical protein